VYWRDHQPPHQPIVIGWQSRLLYDPAKLNDSECSAYGLQRDEQGKWIRPPKYFTSPGLDKGRVLYNYLNARNYPFVVVTEGVFDAFSVGPSAVSLFGKTPTEKQVNLIQTYWDEVILLLDPDANTEMRAAYRRLTLSVRVIHVPLTGAKDAGDMPREEIWRQIARKIEADCRYSKSALASLKIEELTN
jgi:DNA primase